ncbi:hypothetical protein SAMN05421640_1469 [Ekhidna lutea]|uniref:Uncharacterized protein n=2 Tax=Ekhidna lutea TaxID=447679 RepID=A0A239HV75_EKHLU|nr:hypothetical protein SAMN05421640_1469 [Ekhidna lutea]
MSKIEVKTFNPFVGKFSEDKVITHETLALVKTLRNKGFEVEFIPDDSRELKYLFRKGDFTLFQDPFFLFLIGIPTTIVINVINEFIKKKLEKSKEKNPTFETNVNTDNVIINNISGNEIVSIDGKTLSQNSLVRKENEVQKVANEFHDSFKANSPHPELPVPIFLEHTSKIIGWADISINDEGIVIESCTIDDPESWKRIKNSELRGASISGIADKTTCSICEKDYVSCNHVSGEIYNNKMCVNYIVKARLAEISLVKHPANSECVIDILNKNKK